MVDSGHIHCSRYTLILFHVYFLFVGILFLALSTWMVTASGTVHVITIATSSSTELQINRTCYVTMAVTGLMCIVSMIGFVGILKNSKCLFLTIGILTIILMIFELAIGIVAVIIQENVRANMGNELSQTLSRYSGDNATDSVSQAWREAQVSFQCCGINTAVGYQNHSNVVVVSDDGAVLTGSDWYRNTGPAADEAWPESCCNSNTTTCYSGSLEHINQEGCQPKINSFLRTHFFLITIFCVILIIFQIVSAILSIRMFKHPEYAKMKYASSS